MSVCRVCAASINDRTQVRWMIGSLVFCSPNCVWLYRVKERCV